VRSSKEESIISDILTVRPTYLNCNASTPIDPAVVAAMMPFLEDHYDNPSSSHWAHVQNRRNTRKDRWHLLRRHDDAIGPFRRSPRCSVTSAFEGIVLQNSKELARHSRKAQHGRQEGYFLLSALKK